MKKGYILPITSLCIAGACTIIPINGEYYLMASDGTQEKLTLVKQSVKKYSQEITFSSTGGNSRVLFSITINSKGIITSVSVKNLQSGIKNAQYFKKFESGIGKKVIGKNIKTLTLGAVGGASDTTQAFGTFLSNIGGKENVTPTLRKYIPPNTTSSSGTTYSGQLLSSSGQAIIPEKIIRTLSHTVDGTVGQVEITLNLSGSMIQDASSKTIRSSPKTLQAIKKFNQEFGKSVSGKNIRKLDISLIGGSQGLTDAFIKSVEEFQEKPEIRFTFFGSGQIMGSGNTINCSSDCTTVVESKQELIFEARAGTGYIFDKWGGTGVTSTGKMLQIGPITASREIEIHFKKEAIVYGGGGGGGGPVATAVPLLNLGVAVMGAGKVTSNPVGIDCGTSCSQSLSQGTNITLTAVPTIGNIFSGWSGDCSGTSPTCNVSMSQAKNITATFTPEQVSGVKEQTVSYSVPGGLVTQVRFKVTYDTDKVLQSAEAIYVSGDTQSQTFIPNFNNQASTLIIGQKLSDLTDVIILGGASLTTVAFRDFIRSI